MVNNNYKHYVTETFRFYALCGMPTENQLRALKGAFPNKFRGSLADIIPNSCGDKIDVMAYSGTMRVAGRVICGAYDSETNTFITEVMLCGS